MTTASIEVRSNPHCLVCNSRVSVSTRNSYQIFSNLAQTCSERPVNCVMSNVLGKELTELNVHSLIICKKCFKLFNEVDELEMRLAEIKVEIMGNYKRSIQRYKRNGDTVISIDDMGEIKEEELEDGTKIIKIDKSMHKELKKKILDIPSSDEEQESDDKVVLLEDIETQLARLHKEDDPKTDDEKILDKMDTDTNNEEMIEIHIEQESSGSFQGFEVQEVQAEETIDAGAIEDSDDSDYEPPSGADMQVEHEQEQEADNTDALLEAAALAEQTLDEDGTVGDEMITIKMEPGLEDTHKIDRRRMSQVSRKSSKPHKMIKEEFLDPIVARDGNIYTCLACEGDDKFIGEPKAIMLHVKNDHELRVYICDVCGQDFRKRNELSMHLDEHVATEEGDFQCEVCNRIFSNLRLFRIHKRMHYPQSKLWTCETCGKRYSSRNLLEEHINTHTGLRPYVCKVCGKDFASKYTYKAHEKTHEVRPRPFKCAHCPKSFLSQQNLTQHERTHSGVKEYVCHLCGKAFGNPHNLEVHSIVHTGYKPYICGICGKAFARKAEIRDHERMHTGLYPVCTMLCTSRLCGFPKAFPHRWHTYSLTPECVRSCCVRFCCDRNDFEQCAHLNGRGRTSCVFSCAFSRNLLEEHINTHTGLRPYVCKVCGKDFASKYTYKAHEKTHEVRPRPFKCAHCPKSFLSQQNLTQHERTHSGVKEYVCHLCGKAFGNPHNLEVHSIVHTGYKPYICGICGKAFARKAEIRDHERTHTGERPYQCEFCGATFSQRSNLQSHKRATHYDDKRYKCQACGKGFKRRRLLDYHMKAAHTGERPFKCTVCDATFVYPEHFKKHRRIHTGEKPFLCEVCGKAFNSRDNRNAHRFVHSDKKPYECLDCGMGFMRKPLLYAHMQSQGHLNDTIVVNQPRLTTDDDQIVTVNMNGEMELVEHEVGRLEHIGSEAEDGDASEDTKLYIAELKEHVIIQDSDLYGNSKGAMIVGEPMEGDSETTVQDAVKHLIIDGQEVQFAAGDDDSEEHHVLTTQTIVNENGEYEEIVTTDELVEGDTQTIQTSSGPVQLVRIRIPNGDGEEEDAWVKIVPE